MENEWFDYNSSKEEYRIEYKKMSKNNIIEEYLNFMNNFHLEKQESYAERGKNQFQMELNRKANILYRSKQRSILGLSAAIAWILFVIANRGSGSELAEGILSAACPILLTGFANAWPES